MQEEVRALNLPLTVGSTCLVSRFGTKTCRGALHPAKTYRGGSFGTQPNGSRNEIFKWFVRLDFAEDSFTCVTYPFHSHEVVDPNNTSAVLSLPLLIMVLGCQKGMKHAVITRLVHS